MPFRVLLQTDFRPICFAVFEALAMTLEISPWTSLALCLMTSSSFAAVISWVAAPLSVAFSLKVPWNRREKGGMRMSFGGVMSRLVVFMTLRAMLQPASGQKFAHTGARKGMMV